MGLHWKGELFQANNALLKSDATIRDLQNQNNNLIKVLSEVKSKLGSTEVKAVEKLDELNKSLAESSAKVQESVGNVISANAPLVQKIQTSTGAVVTWGVVYGSDQSLDDAKPEVQKTAPKLGLTNAAIYYRRGYYTSVATTTDRLQAETLLSKAKQGGRGPYIVNMSTWCPSVTDKDGYFECSNP